MKFLKNIIVASAFIASSFTIMPSFAATSSESAGQYIDSSVITTQVKAALLKNKAINSTDISVETYKDTVQLSGFVNSADQSAMAQNTAQSVNGVKNVVNSLIVKSTVSN